MKNVPLVNVQTQYGLVEVWGNAIQRWLIIDGIEQSRINIQQPAKLALVVHESFMAYRLFSSLPKKMLLAGLGGGAIASYFFAIDPTIRGDAVEINPIVTGIAKQYFNFPQKNWGLHTMDIRDWRGNNYDLAIVDLANAESTPDWLLSIDMLQQFKQQLMGNGVIAINLLVDDEKIFTAMLKRIRQVFFKRTLCLSVPGYKNIIVFAFNSSPHCFDGDEMAIRAKHLHAETGINFENLLTQLQKDNPVGSGIF